jgi:hypothetical protein
VSDIDRDCCYAVAERRCQEDRLTVDPLAALAGAGATFSMAPGKAASDPTPRRGPGEPAPKVSVLMAAHNAAAYLRQSINSILQQSFRDFELIVVDDASSDATRDIVMSYDDSRIRLIHTGANMGVVGARNLGFDAARGAYLAIQDADDISHPTRLARQVEHLDRHPGDVLVATDIRQMHLGGEMVRPRTGGPASPLLLYWMLHLGNPLAFSSTMMRMSALHRLPAFLREERRYAEDYDLYVRLLAHGGVARLPQPLLIYRVHPESCSARNRGAMIQQTGNILAEIWGTELRPASDRAYAAGLIARHLAATTPAESPEVLREVRTTLQRLTEGFLESHPECSPAERETVALHASRSWEYLVRTSLRAGSVTWPGVPSFRISSDTRLRSRDLLGAALQGLIPRRVINLLRPPPAEEPAPLARPAQGAESKHAMPPVLFVAVVLEGADPSAGAAALDDGRQSAAFALRAQAIFDPYGVRPAYLLDQTVASQEAACLALRNVHDGGGCGIGAWWSDRMTAEPGAIGRLAACIEASVGVPPLFAAAEAMAATDCQPAPSDLAHGLVAFPVSAGVVVPIAPALDRMGGQAMGQSDGPLAGLLNRDDLTRAVSLLPNQIASEPQIILIRSLLARGERHFFVRLHLRQGDPSSATALDRLRRVCSWFFEELGGLPGDARVLRADAVRQMRDTSQHHIGQPSSRPYQPEQIEGEPSDPDRSGPWVLDFGAAGTIVPLTR